MAQFNGHKGRVNRASAGLPWCHDYSRSPRPTSVDAQIPLGPIGQIARTVRDIQESQTWYSGALGLPHLYTFGKLAFFDCGGTRLMLTEEIPFAPSESTLYLRVADIAATHDELRSRGVEFINAPHLIHRHADGTEEWMAFFKDPEGRTLAIMSQVRPVTGAAPARRRPAS
jgi:catechol 2,3-dioxygenase-like lactoylglutathione lyase family enzyme